MKPTCDECFKPGAEPIHYGATRKLCRTCRWILKMTSSGGDSLREVKACTDPVALDKVRRTDWRVTIRQAAERRIKALGKGGK